MGKLSPVLSPVPTPSPQSRSAEREHLAQAIERHRAAVEECDRIKQALEKHGDEVWWPAQKALEAAQKSLAELQATEARALAAQYLGDEAEATKLADARRALEEARAAVDRSELVRLGLAQRAREAEKELEWAKLRLDDAYNKAVAADDAIPALIARYEAARKTVAELETVMEVARRYFAYPYGDTYGHPARRFEDLSQAEATAWRDSLARLREDADAPLPSSS